MRWHEIASGFRVPVYTEEQELLDMLAKEPVSSDTLDERQQELAQQLVSRGVLTFFTKDDKMFFRPSSAKDIWRDK